MAPVEYEICYLDAEKSANLSKLKSANYLTNKSDVFKLLCVQVISGSLQYRYRKNRQARLFTGDHTKYLNVLLFSLSWESTGRQGCTGGMYRMHVHPPPPGHVHPPPPQPERLV
jgi:hypothetical protein